MIGEGVRERAAQIAYIARAEIFGWYCHVLYSLFCDRVSIPLHGDRSACALRGDIPPEALCSESAISGLCHDVPTRRLYGDVGEHQHSKHEIARKLAHACHRNYKRYRARNG